MSRRCLGEDDNRPYTEIQCFLDLRFTTDSLLEWVILIGLNQ